MEESLASARASLSGSLAFSERCSALLWTRRTPLISGQTHTCCRRAHPSCTVHDDGDRKRLFLQHSFSPLDETEDDKQQFPPLTETQASTFTLPLTFSESSRCELKLHLFLSPPWKLINASFPLNAAQSKKAENSSFTAHIETREAPDRVPTTEPTTNRSKTIKIKSTVFPSLLHRTFLQQEVNGQ
ncbi:uncharacterized protein V6R79_003384 [Siganus canaliculatus]